MKSGAQTALKVISIILIVFAAIVIGMGALVVAGAQLPEIAGQTVDIEGNVMSTGLVAGVMGAVFIVAGIMYLIIAIFGIRGANDPSKIGPFFVLCVIGLVLGVVGIFMAIGQGQSPWSSIVGLILIAVCTYLAYSIKKQA